MTHFRRDELKQFERWALQAEDKALYSLLAMVAFEISLGNDAGSKPNVILERIEDMLMERASIGRTK